MTHDLLIMLAVLGAAVVMFALGRPRPDVVALMMIVALPLTGILTPAESVAGFSNAAVILLAGMLVIGEGLARTGVTHRVGDWLIARGGPSELRVMALAMLLVAVLGSVMYKLGMVAIFIPVVLAIAAELGLSPFPFAIAVAIAAASPYMTPLSPVNAMVTTAGNYRFSDFLRIGFPMVLIALTITLVLVPWLYPF